MHWSRFADVLKQAGDLSGRIIVSCSLPMNADDTAVVVGHTSSGAEELARMIPKARVVSAFNTVPSEVLFGVYQARPKATRLGLVYCGDDECAKETAAGLIRDASFDPVDAGPLRSARYTERSRCSLSGWRTRETAARSRRTGSSDSGKRGAVVEQPLHTMLAEWESFCNAWDTITCVATESGPGPEGTGRSGRQKRG